MTESQRKLTDLEKVIRGLEACEHFNCTAGNCPYATRAGCVRLLCNDALALLREQAKEEDDGK